MGAHTHTHTLTQDLLTQSLTQGYSLVSLSGILMGCQSKGYLRLISHEVSDISVSPRRMQAQLEAEVRKQEKSRWVRERMSEKVIGRLEL